MIAKLSLNNIKKSMKDYAIYFFTLVLGIAIFYIFNSIDSQTVMLNINSRKDNIILLLTRLLSATSVFVSFILGSLIIYASRFLIKRRNREFGVYLTLGMSKRKISFILFLETLLIGFISLGAGLPLQEQNEKYLRELGTVVYLKGSLATLRKRLEGSKKDPMLDGEDRDDKIKKLLKQRDPVYQKFADIQVTTGEVPFEELIKEIEEKLSTYEKNS